MSVSVVEYTSCPVCGGSRIAHVMSCKDYTVSGEQFSIAGCADCSVRFTQSVPDAAHIGPYYQSDNYISHSDTDKGLVSKLYKLARTYTLAKKRKDVQRATQRSTGQLLDVGCGTGAFLHAMQQAGWQVTGLEPDATARANAQRLYNLQPQDPAALYHMPAQQFDAITMWHVLEHIHDLHGYFRAFQHCLKADGTLMIAVPNYLSKDAQQYGRHWAAYDVPRHLYHFTPASIEVLARQHGFVVKKVQPMWLDAFYIAMLSEQYQHGKGNLPAAFLSGLRSVWHAYLHPGTCSSQVYWLQKQA